MKLATAVIHIGQDPEANTGAVIPPIYATSTFEQIEPGVTRGYDYTRSGNPNFTNLAATIAYIENARFATVFASGMAAITAVVSSLKQGELIVAEENIYGSAYRLFDKVFTKFGLFVDYYDFSNPDNYDIIRDRRPTMVWLESPTNPLLKIIDIDAISAVAKSVGAIVLVDNTFATPVFQKPLDLGADLSLSSTTKYINGHSDCLGGVVATNADDWNQKMIFAQKALGLNPSPFDSWLISKGIKTLPLRMKKHHDNAMTFASIIESHPLVESVRYPHLPSHPQYPLAMKQMSGGSGIVTVNFRLTLEETKRLVSKFGIFSLAESLGAVESLVSHPASMTHASIPRAQREKVGINDGLVRFSIGIEDIQDLILDFNETIDKIHPGH